MHLMGDSSDSQSMVLRPAVSSSPGNLELQTRGPDPRPTESEKRGTAISLLISLLVIPMHS